jgi:hypothetical protein
LTAQERVGGLAVPVVGLIDLLLFKVYAGGPKSEHDVLELLVRNQVDLVELRRRAKSYRLAPALERILSRLEP